MVKSSSCTQICYPVNQPLLLHVHVFITSHVCIVNEGLISWRSHIGHQARSYIPVLIQGSSVEKIPASAVSTTRPETRPPGIYYLTGIASVHLAQ